jgi:hypothetical protein
VIELLIVDCHSMTLRNAKFVFGGQLIPPISDRERCGVRRIAG